MKILGAVPFVEYLSSKSNKNNKINNYATYPNLQPLAQDTISFTGYKRRDFDKEIMELEPKHFPSEGLREFLLSRLQNPNNNKNILELHKEYYAGLKDCETLDEAKEIYPEFEKVIDAKDIDLRTVGNRSIFRKIAENKVENAKLETFSIELLKKYYGNLIFSWNKAEYFNLDPITIRRTLKSLNIEMNKEYLDILQGYIKSQTTIKLHQNPEFAQARDERITKQHQDPDFEAKRIEALKNKHQDPDFAQARDERITKLNQDPKFAKANAEKMTKQNQDPEFAKRQKVVHIAKKIASISHPYAHSVRVEIAKEFPGLRKAINAKRKGELTESYRSYNNRYFAEVQRRYPELQAEIGALQKEILLGWGFYDKNEENEYIKSPEELIQITTEALEEATNSTQISDEDYLDINYLEEKYFDEE